MGLDEVASWVLKLSKFAPHEARNAYSGLLLVPGWEPLRFLPLIKAAKKEWNVSVAKYADFWDAKRILLQLLSDPLDWQCVQQVRDRAILLLRVLHLCRSVDLARTWRRRCHWRGGHWLWLQRKGARRPQFEKLIDLKTSNVALAVLCPVTLVLQYVALTAKWAPAGSKLFLSLKAPYTPLSASTIGGITKRCLQKLGVPMSAFGAHSTRGAAVKMYKSLGLPSEVVCELGRWKNPTAFTEHYLRLGAANQAGVAIFRNLVHRDPSGNGAEQDRSCRPVRSTAPGQSDLDCEAERQDGPTRPTPKK